MIGTLTSQKQHPEPSLARLTERSSADPFKPPPLSHTHPQLHLHHSLPHCQCKVFPRSSFAPCSPVSTDESLAARVKARQKRQWDQYRGRAKCLCAERSFREIRDRRERSLVLTGRDEHQQEEAMPDTGRLPCLFSV